MQAVRKLGRGADSVQLCELPRPVPKSDEMLVKIMAVGICGTDIHIIDEEYQHTVPITLGHEFTGTIVDMGSDVQGFALGQQIIVNNIARSCGTCHYCRKGDAVHCSSKASIGVNLDGGMAEYAIVPADVAIPVPANMKGSDILAICEPLSCCIRAVLEMSTVKAGDVVVISGPGVIGLLCAQLAKLCGATTILSGTPVDAERLALGKKLGADIVVDSGAALESALATHTTYGPDVWIECSGAAPALGDALRLIRKQGRLIQVGLYGKAIHVDMDAVVRKELTVTAGFATARSSWELLVRLLEQGELQLEELVDVRLPLSKWEEGIRKFRSKEGIKIFLIPGAGE